LGLIWVELFFVGKFDEDDDENECLLVTKEKDVFVPVSLVILYHILLTHGSIASGRKKAVGV
jgi:hypothetical protein